MFATSLTKTAAALACVALAGAAGAQSAAVTLSAPTTSVAPGDTVTVTITADYSVGAAGAGVFGAAGLYGFGGDITSTSSDATGTAPMIDGAFTFGPVAAVGTGGAVATAAAGRGFDGGVAGTSAPLATFDVTIDAGAADGDITLDYAGAVVLVLDDTLTTFSTDPGANQQTLATTGLTLTVSSSSRFCADVNGDGNVTPADFTAWLGIFNNQGTSTPAELNRADVNQDGAVTPADFTAWLGAFNLGANGPTCP